MKTVDVLNAYIEEGENEDEEDEQMNESGGGVTLQVPSSRPVPEIKVSGDKAGHGHSDGPSDDHTVTITEPAGHEHDHGHGHSHKVITLYFTQHLQNIKNAKISPIFAYF